VLIIEMLQFSYFSGIAILIFQFYFFILVAYWLLTKGNGNEKNRNVKKKL